MGLDPNQSVKLVLQRTLGIATRPGNGALCGSYTQTTFESWAPHQWYTKVLLMVYHLHDTRVPSVR